MQQRKAMRWALPSMASNTVFGVRFLANSLRRQTLHNPQIVSCFNMCLGEALAFLVLFVHTKNLRAEEGGKLASAHAEKGREGKAAGTACCLPTSQANLLRN